MFVLGASSDGVEKARLAHACSQVVATGSEPDFKDGRTKVERAIGTPKVLTEHDGLSK